jgi:hypothetical protein
MSGRRRALGTPPADPTRSDIPSAPRWQWRTFPVVAALVAGTLVGAFSHAADNDLAVAVRIAAVFGAAYVMIHLFVMNVIVAGRAKSRRDAAARGEHADDEYEHVIVGPDD